MKLYRISQTVNGGYDTYDSAIVAAPDPEHARKIHPSNDEGDGYEWPKLFVIETWVDEADQDKVIVEYIGEAAEGILEGTVLCASFNAG